MLRVPVADRGRGVGSAAYLAWEAALPAAVIRVRVWVGNTDGRGRPFGFWESLGFRYLACDEDASYEALGWMDKVLPVRSQH